MMELNIKELRAIAKERYYQQVAKKWDTIGAIALAITLIIGLVFILVGDWAVKNEAKMALYKTDGGQEIIIYEFYTVARFDVL